MKRSLLRVLASLLFVCASTTAHAEDAPVDQPPRRRPDALFPEPGKLSLSLATGIPFLAMTELAAGVHERFAVGALAGIAMSGDGPPNNVGFGVRPRVDVWDGGAWRVTATAPTLYYPKATSSWFLTRPSAQLERRFDDGSGVFGGLGVVAVISQDALTGKSREGEPVLPYGGTPSKKAGEASNGIWNTVHLGGAIAVSPRTHLIGEGALILRGLSLPGQEWVGGVPFTINLGVATVL
jgi:hypothetical protein